MRTNRRLIKLIVALACIVAAFAVAIGVFQFASPLKALMKPDRVEGLESDVCYAEVTLKWDETNKAKGYEIREIDENGERKVVGFVEEETEFSISDYEKDRKHRYCVVACSKDPFNGDRYEGEESEPVEALYDSSKYAQKIPVLSYHHIIPAGEIPPFSIFIAVDKLQEQIDYLHDNGFTTLTLDEFKAWHDGKKEFPKKSCVITFDDGLYTTYHLLYPMLKEYGMAATVFCIGHHIKETTDEYDPRDEKSHYIGLDVIEKMKNEYPKLDFQSHTYSMHKRVHGKKPVEFYTYDQMMEDFKLNEKYGFRYLAYPWGTYNDDMQEAAKKNGIEMAFTYDPFYYAKREDDLYAVNRIRASGRSAIEEFAQIVNGEVREYDH